MKGLELSRKYYEAFGAPMLKQEYADYTGQIAVGYAGDGSECFGYDDDISQDHDFGPRFCLWLPDDVYSSIGSRLQESYTSLPSRFMGYETDANNYHSEDRHGVKRISQFYYSYTGCEKGPESLMEWLRIPEHFLAACTNGAVFTDPLGQFTAIRNHILTDMPEDVRKKKIAARAFTMAQTGQYNFSRCLKHGETGAAYLALEKFTTAAIQICFLLNRKHCPYYKWMFRGLKDLPVLSELHAPLLALVTNEPRDGQASCRIIEEISGKVIDELRRQGLTCGTWDYLEPHAFQVQESIQDPEIGALHITLG